LAPNLDKIAVERIRVEFEKLLVGQQAAASLAMAIEDGVVTYLPGQLDQWQFDAIMTDLEAQQPATIPVVWAHLLTRSTLNESEMTTFMRTWKTSRDLIKMATAVVPVARHIARRDLWTLYQIYDYRDVLMHVLRLIRTNDAVIADVDAMFAALPIHHTRELRVAGGQLIAEQIVQPGPQMGRILKQIERAVVTGQVANQPAALLAYAKELSQHD